MALFNEILVGRFNAILHKLLAIKATAPAPTLSTDIQAQIDVLEKEENPDVLWLGGVGLYAGSQLLTAGGAGNNSEIKLFNPGNSGILGVIEGFYACSGNGVAGNPRFGWSTSSFAVAQSATRDPRWWPTYNQGTNVNTPANVSGLRFTGTNNAASTFANLLGSWRHPADTTYFIPYRVVLPPGSNFIIDAGGLNTILTGGIVWRERVIEPSELR